MSLCPWRNSWDPFLSDPWDSFGPLSRWGQVWPKRIFGLNLDDWKELLRSSTPFDWTGRNPEEIARRSGFSRIKSDPNKYSMRLDVSQFAPNEITVKTKDNNIVVTGSHDERKDDHGWVTRQFTRRYPLPEGCKEEDVTSSLTPNGVLIIEVPKKSIETPASNERIVPITMKEMKESIKAPAED